MKVVILFSLLCSPVAPAPAARPQPVSIVAHRGHERGIPENTLAALRHSVERGVEIIELDLRTTSDGQIVIIHDATVDRTTSGTGRVADLTLARLKALDAGTEDYPAERVPTLVEVLAIIEPTSTRLLLDLKSAPLGEVIRLVREHRADDKVILGLRRPKDVARVRAELPGTTTLAFPRSKREAAWFAAAGAQIVRLWSDWVDADPSLVRRTRDLGPQVWVMVGRSHPDKRREWRALHDRMVAAGTQGIITDRPALVVKQ